jgi:hypothetical protein
VTRIIVRAPQGGIYFLLPAAFVCIRGLIAAGETLMLTVLTRLRAPLGALVVLATLSAALTACAITSTGGSSTPTATAAPTNTPVATTCAEVAGFAAATPVNIVNTEFPKDTVVAAPTTSGGGTGQFKVTEYDGCAPNTDVSLTVMTAKGPKAFFDLQQFYGWGSSATFPGDGEVQAACAAKSCLDFGQEHSRYLSVTKATALPNSLVTFHIRATTPPAAPTCGSNFTNSPLKGYQLTTFFNAPLPPLTRAAPDDASGGLRGEDLCGPGTAASITAFMTKALPAAGWTKGADSKCFFSAQCWINGSNAISWQVTDPKDWMVTYRQPL